MGKNVGKTADCVAINYDERKPVIQTVLSPMLLFLRIFGLYYGSTYFETKCSKCFSVILMKVYCYGINGILLFGVVQSIVGKVVHMIKQ